MDLWTQSLWRDEAYSALLIRHDPVAIISLLYGDQNPPLYFLTLKLWASLFGDSEVALRGLSVLLLFATAAAMVVLGRHLGSGALWVGALALTHPFLFRYAFEARGYALLTLLTALAILFALRGSHRLFAATATALGYTHAFGLWIVLLLCGWNLWRRRGVVWATLPIVAIVPLVPWYLADARGALERGPLGAGDVLITVLKLGLPAALLLLPYATQLWRRADFRLLTALWSAPVIGTLALLPIFALFAPRYLIETVPPLIACLGCLRRLRRGTLLLGTLLVVQVTVSVVAYGLPQKADIRSLARYVQDHRESGDIVLNSSALTFLESRYYGLDAKVLAPSGVVPFFIVGRLIEPGDIATEEPRGTRYWLIESLEPGGAPAAPLRARSLSSWEFRGLRLTLYAN